MVLPPTVCGFLLLLFFGKSTSIGRWFIAHGIDIVFTWPAAVIACIVVGFPLMYRTVRGAFENVDASMLDAARTLGWSEGHIFRKLMMPLAWPSIAAGTVLAFARAMGEFGATLFFAGNYVGVTQTIPIAIYFDWMGGQTDVAIFWVIVVILVSFLVILFINIYSSRTQRYMKVNARNKKVERALAGTDGGPGDDGGHSGGTGRADSPKEGAGHEAGHGVHAGGNATEGAVL
jgi:molybdate transport system permease protein